MLKVHPELEEQEVIRLFAAIDLNQSGDIDKFEFVAATIPSLDHERQKQLIGSLFLKLDRSGSGFIPKEELKEALFQAWCSTLSDYF